MALSYRIDRERRLVLLTISGKVTLAGLLELQAQLRRDPLFAPEFGLLADVRAATGTDLDGTAVRRLANASPFGPTARRAALVSHQLGRGIVRMMEAYGELAGRGGPIRTFDDEAQAAAWLAEAQAPAADERQGG